MIEAILNTLYFRRAKWIRFAILAVFFPVVLIWCAVTILWDEMED